MLRSAHSIFLRPSAASEASAISCFGIVVTDVIEISLPNVKTAVFFA
jgi:hypothetical protein